MSFATLLNVARQTCNYTTACQTCNNTGARQPCNSISASVGENCFNIVYGSGIEL